MEAAEGGECGGDGAGEAVGGERKDAEVGELGEL